VINKPLANILGKRREKTEINKIKNGKVGITTNTNEIQMIIRKNLYSNKLENLEKTDKFLDAFN
jgi:hypothetical protein